MSSPNNGQGSSHGMDEELSWEERLLLWDQLLISEEPERTGGTSAQHDNAVGGGVLVLPNRDEFLANGLESLTSPDADPFDDCVIYQDPISVAPTEDLEHAVRIVGCRHVFHNDCLQQWLTSNEVSVVISCPICRFELFENQDYAPYIPPEESEASESDYSEIGVDPEVLLADPTAPLSAVQAANIRRIVALEDALEDQAELDQPTAFAHEEERAQLQAQFLQMGGFARLLELQRRTTELEGRREPVPEEMETEYEEFRAELLEVWQRLQAYGT